MSGVVTPNDRDGCIRTRQVPVNEKRGMSLHARRPQQRTPLSIARAAKRTWFNKARTAHLPRLIFKSIFLAVFNSTIIGYFVCLLYLQESLLEPAGLSTTHTHTYIYNLCNSFFLALECILFAWPLLRKRKAVEIRNICLCVKAIHGYFLTNTCQRQ